MGLRRLAFENSPKKPRPTKQKHKQHNPQDQAMKLRQTRYSTEAEIINKIDAPTSLRDSKNQQAELLEALAQECAKKVALLEMQLEKLRGNEAETIRKEIVNLKSEFWKNRDLAVKSRRRARTIEEASLPKISRGLAAFRTIPIEAACRGDVAVLED
jgi:DNA gyrase/topoisomerase IV subunit A